MRIKYHAAAAALAALSLPAAAQLKPGLWEITSKMGGNAQLDAAQSQLAQQLASMPPEQRRQMEAVMAQRGMSMPGQGRGGGTTVKVCMSKEQVARNDVPMREGCSVTQSSRNGNVTKVAFACSNPPSTGDGEFTSMGPDAYASRMNVTTQVQGRSQSMTMEGSGRWLSADCGNIQPMQAPRR
ncbi:MAG TPA: DUF3617 domain-containing protein [Ramlibacter sp.]|uniref:DUF3617 domain-containing protein n=1 Tax=Ramlibacter sp. TaxID=1917967 RepID=UPI002CA4BE0A|nr:DUF3617 domain-containing protein [Ramlibacter sp.]HVZ43931.1 DUF3617 domain-containing protein [Ramlibacter sp.]